MSDTLLSSLSSTLSLANRGHLARLLSEPEPSISQGLESATAAIFAGLRNQINQPEAMRQLFSDIPEAIETTLEVAEKCQAASYAWQTSSPDQWQ